MAGDPQHFLNELAIWKLKLVAEVYRIDVSSCKHKRDFVEKIRAKNLTEEEVRTALEKAKVRPVASKAEAPVIAEVKEIEKDLKRISEKSTEPQAMPSEDDATIERNIDQALLMKPVFFEIDTVAEKAWNRMILADYVEAIKLNREARNRALASFSAFQVFSTALSIRAAETLLRGLAQDGALDSNLKTALAAAKKAFIDGQPKRREETLSELEALATAAFDAFINKSDKAEAELKAMLTEYESFGVITSEPRRLLDIADQAKRAFNVAEYARLLKEAREHAEYARAARETEIRKALRVVRAAVHEAKDVGAATPSAEDGLQEAEAAIEQKSFRRALELMASIEQAADRAHLERIRQKDVEASQLAKINTALTTYAPELEEASSYGMDVNEGLLFVHNTRAAMQNNDLVNAAKYARRMKELAEPIRESLDKVRVEKGVAKHLEDAKCGKCGSQTLYAFPNNVQKCMECGHSFTFAQPAQAQQPQTASQPPQAPAEQKSRMRILRKNSG